MDSAEVATRPETLDELVERIEQQHAALPRRLQEIGSFALGHPEAIALSTLAELADETDHRAPASDAQGGPRVTCAGRYGLLR